MGWLIAALRAVPMAMLAIALGWPGQLRAQQAMPHELHPEPLVVETSTGERRIEVEIADETHERTQGLMFRQDLPQDRGLLFVFERTGRLAFWMKNTPLPLDLVFIAENGRVAAIRQGEPFSETSISPPNPARFVLELNRGQAAALGIRPGTRLRHPVIDAISGR
jgi:uncharacterized membrane protein (UPF0127 family)